jgi:hypothetical protein
MEMKTVKKFISENSSQKTASFKNSKTSIMLSRLYINRFDFSTKGGLIK